VNELSLVQKDVLYADEESINKTNDEKKVDKILFNRRYIVFIL
tara:strand:- start:704 stop:832 length:129 start_codon:yes stop_codon:yes gene_type:complete